MGGWELSKSGSVTMVREAAGIKPMSEINVHLR